MSVGTESWEGQAVPLVGESEIVADTAANDIITITGAGSQSGDYLVLRDSSHSELFYVDASGNVVTTGNVTGVNVIASGYLATKDSGTVAPDTTAIATNGGLMVAVVSGTHRLYWRQNGTVHYVNATS